MNDIEQSKKDGRKFLFIILTFFLVFASVDAYFIYMALSTHKGVVTKNAYERGLHYNDILNEARARQRDENEHTEPALDTPTTNSND